MLNNIYIIIVNNHVPLSCLSKMVCIRPAEVDDLLQVSVVHKHASQLYGIQHTSAAKSGSLHSLIAPGFLPWADAALQPVMVSLL